nr:immunoglobulin heavy chain junction region [Macaca mulatta]
CARREDDLDLW